MKFMAPPRLTGPHQQAVPLALGQAIAQPEAAGAGLEGQHPGHGPSHASGIHQPLPEQQEPAAFRHDRYPAPAGPRQGDTAASGIGQGRRMEFGIPPGKHDGGAVFRQGVIRQGTPEPHGQAQGLQTLAHLRVEEMEGGVPGDHNGARSGGLSTRPVLRFS